jgi:hypothetical protein
MKRSFTDMIICVNPSHPYNLWAILQNSITLPVTPFIIDNACPQLDGKILRAYDCAVLYRLAGLFLSKALRINPKARSGLQ